MFDDLIPNDHLSFDDLVPATDKKKEGVFSDLLKSSASGLGRGVASIPGIAGDMHELAKAALFAPKRSLYDALMDKAGISGLPTSEQTIAKASEYVPGLNYKPETTAGEYAQRAGEFIPSAVVGGEGGMARNAIRYGAIPGLASEAASQATKGTDYEPQAALIGALAGAHAGPSITNIPGKILAPIEKRPQIAAAVSTLEKEGVPLTAGQRTGNRSLQWLEAAAADMPFSARSAADINADQGAALNRAFAKKMGHEIKDENGLMNDEEWKAVKKDFKTRYGQLNSKTIMKHDAQLASDIDAAHNDYNALTSDASRAPIIKQWADAINGIPKTNAGVLPGDIYQEWRSDIAKNARKSGEGSKEEIALTDMKRALDSAINRSTSPDLAPIRAEVNRDYANYKELQKSAGSAGENAARGYISPAIVRSNAARRKTTYLEGRSDLGNIAQAAEAVMKQLPSSGTAQRQAAMNLFQPASAITGLAAGGLPGLLAGYVAPAATARALMSRPVQNWLGGKYERPGLVNKPSKAAKREALIRAGLLGATD